MLFKVIYLDKPLNNGIIFKTEFMETVIEKYKKTYIDIKESFGELCFSDQEIISEKEVNKDKISHIVKDIWIEDDYLYADIGLLKEYTNGKAVYDYMKNGFGFSLKLKGFGSADQYNVVYDYNLISLYLIHKKVK